MASVFILFSFIFLVLIKLTSMFKTCKNSYEVKVNYAFPPGLNHRQLTTRHWIFFQVSKRDPQTPWPKNFRLAINRINEGSVHFIFRPFNPKQEMVNSRIYLKIWPKSQTSFSINMTFLKFEDDDSQWTLSYSDTFIYQWTLLCRFFIRSEPMPYVILSHKLTGQFIKLIPYHEDDKVDLICTIRNMKSSHNFLNLQIVLPPKTLKRDQKLNKLNTTLNITIQLTKEIWDQPIFCTISDGLNTTNHSILRFIKKHHMPKPPYNSGVIAQVVVVCLVFIAFVVTGVYFLIVKMRQETTKTILYELTKRTYAAFKSPRKAFQRLDVDNSIKILNTILEDSDSRRMSRVDSSRALTSETGKEF